MVDVADDSRPSHMTALRNARFALGSGRRYSEASLLAGPHANGSDTESIVNSAPARTSIPTRIRPRVSSMLYASRFWRKVFGAAPSQFEPSLLLKIGSVPLVKRNRRCTFAGVI